MPPLPRSFYERDSRVVARELLNKVLVRDERRARLVEVEAYAGGEDPGSHAYRGMTRRNATMFGPPGHLYVYFTYGMHFCANAVCGSRGEAVAVLLRAAAPLEGLGAMVAARGGAGGGRRRLRAYDLCSGPAKLCQAFGLTRDHDGADLVTGDRGVTIDDDGTSPPEDPGVSARVGLSAGAHFPWRFYVKGDSNVSRHRVGIRSAPEAHVVA